MSKRLICLVVIGGACSLAFNNSPLNDTKGTPLNSWDTTPKERVKRQHTTQEKPPLRFEHKRTIYNDRDQPIGYAKKTSDGRYKVYDLYGEHIYTTFTKP